MLPEIYEAGFPVMAAGHDKALCEVKLPQFTDDVEAIKDAVKSFVFDTCKAEANWNMTNFVNDQIELIRRQVATVRCCWHCPVVWIAPWWPLCC
ncbi:GMP synthase (glutamine-hydrolyzing) [human gut metagenome]|uniref:GMP synthase (Glutamine-hydrolyzing) n=1 Tax=human gut metagenome TaxID=408170 RepID=K1SZ99_9ZZZZ